MGKFWLVAAYEYQRHVKRRRFLLALLSVPGLIAVMVLVGVLTAKSEVGDKPIGYVDHSGLLAAIEQPVSREYLGEKITLLAFESDEQAQEAIERGEIGAYYVLPADYLQTRRVQLVYDEKPDSTVENMLEDMIRQKLLEGQHQSISQRIIQGVEYIVRSPDGEREMVESEWGNLLLPIAIGMIFVVAIFSSAGYLMQAVVEEKENRTMEIIITSVNAFQMMGGKILGIIAVGFTQVTIWLGFVALLLIVGGRYFPWLAVIKFDLGLAGLMLLAVIPGFVTMAALMAAVGALVTEAQEAQQMTGLFTLPAMAPYWFSYQLMTHPNSPLAIGLSYFPLTAPVALSLRLGFARISPWGLSINLVVLTLGAFGALWLAARALRIGMLRYGKKVSLRELFTSKVEG